VNRIQQILYKLLISHGSDENALKGLFDRILSTTGAILTYYRYLTTSAEFKYWLQFYGLFSAKKPRDPTFTDVGYLWASLDYRNSKYLNAVCSKYRKSSNLSGYSTLIFVLGRLSPDILSRELTAPVYVDPMPTFEAAQQDLASYTPPEPTSVDSLNTAASGISVPPSSNATDPSTRQGSSAVQAFLVIRAGNPLTSQVHQLRRVTDLAIVNEVCHVAEHPLHPSTLNPQLDLKVLRPPTARVRHDSSFPACRQPIWMLVLPSPTRQMIQLRSL
jgi:hypothetical protein